MLIQEVMSLYVVIQKWWNGVSGMNIVFFHTVFVGNRAADPMTFSVSGGTFMVPCSPDCSASSYYNLNMPELPHNSVDGQCLIQKHVISYFVHAFLLYGSRITLFYPYYIIHLEIWEEKTEHRSVLFSAVSLSSFAGNCLKQLPKVRGNDGPWNY